jgi:predicted Zn-dependent protease
MSRPSLQRLALGLLLVLASGLAARPQEQPAVAGPVGKVTDREGIAARKGLAEPRWTPAEPGAPLFAGDWIKTGARGANALAVELTEGGLLLGPGALVEVVDGARVRLLAGEVELTPRAKSALTIDGTSPPRRVTARTVFRATSGASEALAQDPRWLTGYRTNASTDAVGALVAKVDGRDVPLTLGYHKVTVDIRDQLARTEIEESFVNHTGRRLEGTFFFPLPPDASISGFAMWIGDQQVHGEIVEKQRARAIFETILREKRDPALLEWAGGSLFKARVFPIEPGSSKRVKLTYTQVLAQTVRPDGKGELVYRHALASEHLRLHPLAKLALSVTVSSQRPIVDVRSPTHACRIQRTEHGARAEHEAEDVSPERDFELRIAVTRPAAGLTVASHRRGDDGYFLLLLDAPAVASSARPGEPLDLLILADTSGSLAGAARAAQVRFVAALLEGLGPKDTFNLATCDLDVGFAFERPREPTPAAREEALGALEGRPALGWTDLDRAIAAAAKRAGPRTQIVYVGDGAVTTGDADPQAFARRAPALYQGRGTFHAVVPGSLAEPAALQAIAKLGGGTVRTIGGAPPQDVAFALLAELQAPCAKDLRLRFEGLEVAAVYPEVLPALRAGTQQVVVGRWNAATAPAEGQRGRVTLTGRLGDTALSTTHELALGASVTTGAAVEDDASFIPRLWARHHLEHLLSQGSTKTLQERVVALSEEFQLMTPYTSFLVLESDADRERFQVKKRLRLRDGEEFFAQGRADAEHALTRQAMLAARRWRQDLKRRTLEDLADLGRTEGVEALRRALPGSGALAWLRPSGGGGSFSFDTEEDSDEAEEEDDEPRVEEALDEALPSDADEEEEEEEEEEQEERADVDEDEASFDQDVDLDGEASTPTFTGVLSFDGGGTRSYVGGSFGAWLPDFSQAWRAEATSEPAWPADVRAALASVDLTVRLGRAQGGGLRVRTDHCLWLLGSGRWVQSWFDDAAAPTTPTVTNWLAPSTADGALERGVVEGTWGLGRVRPAVPADAQGWETPWAYAHLLADLSEGPYASDVSATVRSLDAGQVEVTIHEPPHRTVLVLEPARGVLRAIRFSDGSGVSWDVAEVGGGWYPTREVRTDATGAVTGLRTFVVEALAPAAFDEALAAALSTRASSALVGALPQRRAARAALRAGTPRLEDHWVLLERLARQDRWDAARQHLDAVLAAVPSRAAEALQAAALRLSRRHEELRLHLRGLADALVATPRPLDDRAARDLLEWAQELGPDEQLDLIARVTPVIERAEGSASSLWHAEAEVLERAGRPDEALARLRALAAAWPEQVWNQLELARGLFKGGEPDAAVAHLDEALAKHGPWSLADRVQVAQAVVGFHAALDDDAAVVARAERLEREDPDVASAVAREHLTALTMLGRDDAVDARLAAWIEAALAGPLAGPTKARLDAAVWHVSRAERPMSDERARLLARLVLTQPEREDLSEVVSQLFSLSSWQEHAVCQATSATLAERLDRVDALQAVRLLQLLRYHRPPNEDARAASWERVLERLEAELKLLSREDRRAAQLRWALELYGDDDRRLRLLREDHAAAQAEGDPRDAAAALLQWFLEREWTAEAQEETLALAVTIGPRAGDAPDVAAEQRVGQVLLLHRLVDWATTERAEQAVAARPDHDELDQREMLRATDEALGAARGELLGLLDALDEQLPALRDWVALERTWLQVTLGREREAARAACLALLDARLARTSTTPEDALVADRALDTLLLLAGTDEGAAQAASATALAARLERALAARDDLLDWREARVSLLLVCDRLDEAEAALREQLERTPQAGFPLACVLAERDRLAEAAAVVERLASDDEVGPRELLTLATWYTALDRPDAARDARARAFALADVERLTESLRRDLERVAPDDEERAPEPLDPSTALKLLALARKASPSDLVDLVRSFYEATRDHRLLGALAEGVLGQSQENVYALLEAVQELTDLLQEEATLHQLRGAIAAAQARAGTTPQDARALHLLELLALSAAVSQDDPQRASTHADAALEAMRAAWLPDGVVDGGQAQRHADLLARQGALPGALGQEQLRQLQVLVRLGADPVARLDLTRPLASALVAHGRPDDAARALLSALDAARGPDGLLPPRLHWALREAAAVLLSMDRCRDAEGLFQRELEPPGPGRHGVRAARGLRHELHRVRLATLSRNGEGLGGAGAALYRVAEEALRADLARTSDPSAGEALLALLCEVWEAGARFGPVGDDVKRFAFGELPGVLARHRPSRATSLIGSVVAALALHTDAVTALELLVLRTEAEPVAARLRGVHLWGHLGETFGALRARAGAALPPTLALRLLTLTKAELRRALLNRRGGWHPVQHHVPGLCADRHDRHFWAEHRATWRQLALDVLGEHPEDATVAHVVAGYLFDDLSCRAEAIDLLRDLDRRGALEWPLRHELSRWLELEQRHAEAIPHMRRLVDERPTDLDVRLQLVRTLARTGELEQAVRALKDAEAYLREVEVWQNQHRRRVGDAFLELELPAEAVRLADEAVAHHLALAEGDDGRGGLYWSYQLLAEAHSALDDTPRAVDAACAAVLVRGADRDEDLGRALQLLDRVLAQSTALDAYVEQVDRQERETGLENAILRRAIGHAYREQGEPAAAEAHLRRALAAAPNDVELRRELVELLDELGRPADAAEELHGLAVVAPYDASRYLELGDRWAALGQDELAERAWTTLVEQLPHESGSHEQLALLREQQDRLPEAIEQWRQVVRVRADEPEGWVRLARALAKSGAKDEARAIARQLLATGWDERFGDAHGVARDLLDELGD